MFSLGPLCSIHYLLQQVTANRIPANILYIIIIAGCDPHQVPAGLLHYCGLLILITSVSSICTDHSLCEWRLYCTDTETLVTLVIKHEDQHPTVLQESSYNQVRNTSSDNNTLAGILLAVACCKNRHF